jgi:hypothetical protein
VVRRRLCGGCWRGLGRRRGRWNFIGGGFWRGEEDFEICRWCNQRKISAIWINCLSEGIFDQHVFGLATIKMKRLLTKTFKLLRIVLTTVTSSKLMHQAFFLCSIP